MTYTYTQQKNRESKRTAEKPLSGGGKELSLPNSAMVENLGHQVDMPTVMREKMEDSFGMDLSGVKLYENKAVGKAGAEAVAQGSKIAFAPGKLDFSSTRGQALLGHEISHIASQARGEVKGSGLVNDSALEARADREGLMAARGESVTQGYGGAAAALSSSSAASAAGPMQAKSGRKKLQKKAKADMEEANSPILEDDIDLDNELTADKMFRLGAAKMRQDQEYGTAKQNKIDELKAKYYNENKNNGLTDNQALNKAEDDAIEDTGDLIKKKDYRYLSDEEQEWLDNMLENPDLDILRVLNRRRNQLGEQVYQHRQNLAANHPGEDKEKMDLETAYSPIGTNYSVYDLLLSYSKDEDVSKKLQEIDVKNANPEQTRIQKNAQETVIHGSNKLVNNYLKTNQGKEQEKMLFKQHLKRLGELSGKKKKLRIK